VAGDTPLGALMPAMARSPFLLGVEGRAVSGLVTPSDLNKQAGRTYYYLLVAAVEMNLAERIREYFADQEACSRCCRKTGRSVSGDGWRVSNAMTSLPTSSPRWISLTCRT
jgi:hypothetical protein